MAQVEGHRTSAYCFWRMIFSENRLPPRIKCGAGFFRIMRVGHPPGIQL
jgi:hypothetical protein